MANRKRKSLLERDGGDCMICGCPLRLPGEPKKNFPKNYKAATIHHEIGIAEGGTHSIDNLCLVCIQCHAEIHKEEIEKLIKDKKNLIRVVKEQNRLLAELGFSK